MNHIRKTSAAAIASCLMLGSFAVVAQGQGQPPAQAQAQSQGPVQTHAQGQQGKPSKAQVEQVVKNWKDQPRKVAMEVMGKYGPPDEVTPQRLVWHNNGPWKRTELVNEEINHDFPLPHKDMLYQFVNLEVPPDKFDEIAAFDGSIIINRTRGEIAAFCDKEPANFLALNLAYQIATNKLSVADARKAYGEQIAALASNRPAPLTDGLIFQPPQTAGFSDQPIIDPTAAMKEQMKKMGAVRQ